MSDPWAQAKSALETGERFFWTVEHGDLEDLRTIFADGAVVWHNTDEKLVDVETSIGNLRRIRSTASEFRYTEVRREPTPVGFVQQHTLIFAMPGAPRIRDLCACICAVKDGRISRMDAYHDSAATHAMPHRTAQAGAAA